MQPPLGSSDSALTNQIPPESVDQHITGGLNIIILHFCTKKKVLKGHFGHLPEIPKKRQHNNPVTLSMLL